MKITLRKASALQNAINDTLKSIELKSEVSLNEYQDAESLITAARVKLFAQVERKVNLHVALYDIRNAVAVANHTQNVGGNLTEVARIEKDIQVFSSLAAKAVREDAVVIAGKMEKLKTRKEDSYYRADGVDTSVLMQDDLDRVKTIVADLKKNKQQFQDMILETNVRTEIELGEKAEATLRSEGLL